MIGAADAINTKYEFLGAFWSESKSNGASIQDRHKRFLDLANPVYSSEQAEAIYRMISNVEGNESCRELMSLLA